MPHLTKCNARATHEMPSSKLKEQPPQRKIGVTSNLPVGRISVVTLIRTDTTLDHSQKAKKVWPAAGPQSTPGEAASPACLSKKRHTQIAVHTTAGSIQLWTRCQEHSHRLLAAARKQAAPCEILLWVIPSEAPKALQASECRELLDPMRANCWISAQH